MKTTLIIQPSPACWSLYDPDRANDGPLAALVCSSNDLYELVKYAIEDLDSPVQVTRDPVLFTEGTAA
jgi:hypothetical protein